MLDSLLVVETSSSPSEPVILITAICTVHLFCGVLLTPETSISKGDKYIDIPRVCIALCEFQEENNNRKTRNIGNVCYNVGNKSHQGSDEMEENVSKELIKHQV